MSGKSCPGVFQVPVEMHVIGKRVKLTRLDDTPWTLKCIRRRDGCRGLSHGGIR